MSACEAQGIPARSTALFLNMCEPGFRQAAKRMTQPLFRCVQDFEIAEFIVVWRSPVFSVLLELMKVAIGPAHDRLLGTWMRRQIGGSMPRSVIFSW